MTLAETFVLFDGEGTLLKGSLIPRLSKGLALRASASERKLKAALDGFDAEKLEQGKISAKDLLKAFGKAVDKSLTATKLAAWLGESLVYSPAGLTLLTQWATYDRAAVVGGSMPGIPERMRTDLLALVPPERHLYAHEAGASLSDPAFYQAASEAFQKDIQQFILFSPNEARRKAALEAGCQAVVTLTQDPTPVEPEATAAPPEQASGEEASPQASA